MTCCKPPNKNDLAGCKPLEHADCSDVLFYLKLRIPLELTKSPHMKKQLLFILLSLFFFTSCDDESSPDSGEIYFELTFAEEVKTPNKTLTIINFGFQGGDYEISSGRKFVTDKYLVAKGTNLQYVISGYYHTGCIPTEVKAIYRDKVIQTDNFEIGVGCPDTYDINSTFTKNIIIP
jgi:hypothetical protein